MLGTAFDCSTACGGSKSSATSATATPGSAATTSAAGRGGNRTPNSQIQTSIAQGTPPPARGGRGGIATAIAQGTPAVSLFPNADAATAFAEGTPGAGFRGGPGGGGGQLVASVATALSISEEQLRTELQAPGATIATVAVAHGKTRDAVKLAILAMAEQREADAVSSGRITQQQADQTLNQLDTSIDNIVDGNGSGGFGPGGFGGPPVQDGTPAP